MSAERLVSAESLAVTVIDASMDYGDPTVTYLNLPIVSDAMT